MAKKKKARSKPSSKEFTNSPFKSLKGLSALESDESANKVSLTDDTVKVNFPEGRIEETSFTEEMDFLGVRPLSGQPGEENRGLEPGQVVARPRKIKSDQEEFLEAVGSIDKVFKDEWPDEGEAKRATPRRMKQVAKRQLKPQAQLDLHGLTVEEASEKVKFFLQNSIYNGLDIVVIITGKGLHSEEGPVLRKAVDRLLSGLRELVVEWGVAPRSYGGDGALIVFLRKSGEK